MLTTTTVILFFGSVKTSHACGPFFPNNLLDSGDQSILVAPTANFRAELERMKLVTSRFVAVLPDSTNSDGTFSGHTMECELNDLRTALRKAKTSKDDAARIEAAHTVARAKLRVYSEEIEGWRNQGQWVEDERGGDTHLVLPNTPPPVKPEFKSADGLPAEFADYFEGALAWRNPSGEATNAARAAWERLLQRPAEERKFKSTWAAYMLGKSWEKADADKAMNYFRQVRKLAKEGFADSTGLAAASLGWEARLNWKRREFDKAIDLYLEQLAAGDDSAGQSLYITASDSLNASDELLARLAKNARAQKVITAYLVSSGRDSRSEVLEWLNAVEAAGVNDVDSAEKLALAAYKAGAFEQAGRWVKRAPKSAVAQWIEAKLLMHEGKVGQAAALLAKLSRAFPVEDIGTNSPTTFAENLSTYIGIENIPIGRQVLGELGALRLARREYSESLDALLRSGYWQDTAYVAERVMTLDELKTYVDGHWPQSPPAPKPEVPSVDTDDEIKQRSAVAPEKLASDIRYLLARRLTRSQRGSEARSYFPENWLPHYDELMTMLDAGWNESAAKEERANNLFRAAFIVRTNGMELMGTEVGPDWHVHDGQFDYGVSADARTNENTHILAPTADELRRAASHEADPEVRFHYRHQAAFLGMEAAKLLPNNSDETARILCISGSWLKNRDPETADIFYKSLVRRCRKTEIGAEADRIRWFPQLDDEGKVIPREAKTVNFEMHETPVIESASEASAAEDSNSFNAAEKVHGYEHTVATGDTIGAILKAYNEAGVGVTIEALLEANPGLESKRLKVGQKIFVPTDDSTAK
ncbi:MAG: LysM peptidoglycan-binding domain-containing protein [Verrucomicrobia bacterium]|nr:LysM peptidoglycan-binding domain-containing protein [Verrucomicrobiota bacterium]